MTFSTSTLAERAFASVGALFASFMLVAAAVGPAFQVA